MTMSKTWSASGSVIISFQEEHPLFSFLCDSCIQIQVMVEGRTKSRAAILNRPSALNSLNTAMVGLCYSSGFCCLQIFKGFCFGGL